jgi:hypothetical protein
MESKMKKIILAIILFLITLPVFSQQGLWTTRNIENDATGIRYVPLSNVTKEVLTFYNQYNYYFDLSGYSKKRFIEETGYGFNDWSMLNEINELTVFAFKTNMGRGSVIMVLCVSKDNVNLLLFSNDITLHENPQNTGSYKKDKFIDWFTTLLN